MSELKALGYVRVVKQGHAEGESNIYELSWLPCSEVTVQDEDVDPISMSLEEETVEGEATVKTGEIGECGEGSHLGNWPPVAARSPISCVGWGCDRWPDALGNHPTQPAGELRGHSLGGREEDHGNGPGADGEQGPGALAKALGEVAAMVDAGLVDDRGPAGLIASKVANYCQLSERDFGDDAIRAHYLESQQPCTEQDRHGMDISRDYVRMATERMQTQGIVSVEAWMDGQWRAVPRYLFLKRHGRPFPDGLLDEAGSEWTFSNREVRDFCRDLFKDVGVEELEEYRKGYLEEHGLPDMDEPS